MTRMIIIERVAGATGTASPPSRSTAESTDDPHHVNDQGRHFYRLAFTIHKWSGLVAALWLSVLGCTGFFLDHGDWRWQWQGKVPTWLAPAGLTQSAARSVVRLLQIDPLDSQAELAGGPRGLWYSTDGGLHWTRSQTANGQTPQGLAIEPDPQRGWQRLWIGTDDGLYVSTDGGKTLQRAALPGRTVTGLTADARSDQMLGVVDKSRLFRFATDTPGQIAWLDLQPPPADSRPNEISLQRYVIDLHFGRGLFGPNSSRLVNDIGGVGMLILCLTGLLYWGLPKLWKWRERERHRVQLPPHTKPHTKKMTMLWLFRLHSVSIGIVSALMILYLAVTGMLIGHSRELGTWMKRTAISRTWLTPTYRLAGWDGWIENIVGYPGQPDRWTIGNRVGLFTTEDGGKSWRRDRNPDGTPIAMAMTLRRIGDHLLMPNGMSGPSLIRDSSAQSHAVKPQDHPPPDGMASSGSMSGMFMPTDVTLSGNRFTWRSMDNLLMTDEDGNEVDRRPFRQPVDDGVPWFTFFVRLHNGAIFWSEWRWVNDLFATFAIVLTITGLIRWWRKKIA